MLENHQHTCAEQSDYIASRLHDCLTDIEKCLAGVNSRFASSLINLEAGLKGLDGKMFQVRQELYQQCIASFMFQQQRQALVIIPPCPSRSELCPYRSLPGNGGAVGQRM